MLEASKSNLYAMTVRGHTWRLAPMAALAAAGVSSCQVLAQTTHPHTPEKEGGKAFLQCVCERVEG